MSPCAPIAPTGPPDGWSRQRQVLVGPVEQVVHRRVAAAEPMDADTPTERRALRRHRLAKVSRHDGIQRVATDQPREQTHGARFAD